jgi:hypothetical protein
MAAAMGSIRQSAAIDATWASVTVFCRYNAGWVRVFDRFVPAEIGLAPRNL